MKFIVALAALVSCALALPPPPRSGAPPAARAVLPHGKEGASVALLRYVNDANPDGSYSFGFETENGITRDETGVLKTVKDAEGKDSVVVVKSGSYAYPGLDGRSYNVNYVADETGFHAEGEHIHKN